MEHPRNIRKTVNIILLVALLIVFAAGAGLCIGYRRGYDHGEKIANKWWIDQQSQYYGASQVEKKRRDLFLDRI